MIFQCPFQFLAFCDSIMIFDSDVGVETNKALRGLLLILQVVFLSVSPNSCVLL